MERFRILGFGHVGISVRDKVASRKFYEDVLGVRPVWAYGGEKVGGLLFIGK